jgi:hypothetical protein
VEGQHNLMGMTHRLEGIYPINVAEFAISHDIHIEAAFAWWVLDVLAKRN